MTRTVAAVLLTLGLAVAACGGTSSPAAQSSTGQSSTSQSSSSPSATTSSGSGPTYVALGDSYTAAPYVYLTDVADGCLRSNHNYPALLAKAIHARLTDVSCGGATTKDLGAPQQTFGAQHVPAQLDAVGRGTRLVTLGIGGNDFGLFGSLSTGCPITGPDGKPVGAARPAGTRCGQVDLTTAERDLAGIQDNVTTAVKAVQAKAPGATIVLVGYPRIASTTTTCPSVLPATLADEKSVDAVTRGLSKALNAAAKATGATFIDMYDASVGHDVCAGSAAWVNGVTTDTQRAAPLHPFAKEQQAVASLIEKALAG